MAKKWLLGFVGMLGATLALGQKIDTTTSKRFVAGIEVRPQVSQIMNEVERLTGQKITVGILNQRQPFVSAESGFSISGVPWVVLYRPTGLSEGVIAHELMHLKLGASGVLRLRAFDAEVGNADVGYPGAGIKLFLSITVNDLANGIDEGAFYPQLRTWGFKPNGELAETLRSARTLTEIPLDDQVKVAYHLDLDSARYLRALFYFRTARGATADERGLLDAWYQTQGWTQEMLTGKAMNEAIASADLASSCSTWKAVQKALASLNSLTNSNLRYDSVGLLTRSASPVQFLLVAPLIAGAAPTRPNCR